MSCISWKTDYRVDQALNAIWSGAPVDWDQVEWDIQAEATRTALQAIAEPLRLAMEGLAEIGRSLGQPIEALRDALGTPVEVSVDQDVGPFQMDGRNGVAFWVMQQEEDLWCPVYYSDLPSLQVFLTRNFGEHWPEVTE